MTGPAEPVRHGPDGAVRLRIRWVYTKPVLTSEYMHRRDFLRTAGGAAGGAAAVGAGSGAAAGAESGGGGGGDPDYGGYLDDVPNFEST